MGYIPAPSQVLFYNKIESFITDNSTYPRISGSSPDYASVIVLNTELTILKYSFKPNKSGTLTATIKSQMRSSNAGATCYSRAYLGGVQKAQVSTTSTTLVLCDLSFTESISDTTVRYIEIKGISSSGTYGVIPFGLSGVEADVQNLLWELSI